MSGYALPSESEERVVVESVQAGDDAALELLYSKYAPALRDFCRGRLADRTEAEDACHEAMLKARKAFSRFKPGARVWPWLATIAANVCIDIHLAHARSAHLNASTDLLGEEPEEEVARRAHIQIVIDSLRALPQDYRSYIYLRDYDGWSYEQIARFYETSVTSVRSLLFRARQSLKEEIKRTAKSRGRWPLSALIPRAWMRLRSTVSVRKHSMSETVYGSWRASLSGAVESISALGPALSNTAVAVAVALFIAGGGSPAIAASPPNVPPVPSAVPANTPATPANAPGTGNMGAIAASPTYHPPASSEASINSPPVAVNGEPVQSGPPVDVTVTPPSQSDREQSSPGYQTDAAPGATVTTDFDGDGDKENEAPTPQGGVQCGDPNDRGIVLALTCPVLDQVL